MFEWLRNLFTHAPAPLQVLAPVADDGREEARREASEQARRDVRAGYLTADEIREGIVDSYADDLEPAEAQALATAAIIHERRRIEREQQDWPVVTDYDRLEAGFAALEAAGVVARENFTCCGTCGAAEIGDEIDTAQAAGIAVRGYTFFHWQDTDSAVDGHGLYLSYGAIEDTEGAGLAIGRDIMTVLERSGLQPSWNGRSDTRILVPLDWKRRV